MDISLLLLLLWSAAISNEIMQKHFSALNFVMAEKLISKIEPITTTPFMWRYLYIVRMIAHSIAWEVIYSMA